MYLDIYCIKYSVWNQSVASQGFFITPGHVFMTNCNITKTKSNMGAENVSPCSARMMNKNNLLVFNTRLIPRSEGRTSSRRNNERKHIFQVKEDFNYVFQSSSHCRSRLKTLCRLTLRYFMKQHGSPL